MKRATGAQAGSAAMFVRVGWTPFTLKAALLAGLCACHTPPASAGSVNDPTNCGCRADTSGGAYCWGTLQCFRQLPDPDAFADMFVGYTSTYLQVSFTAIFNGTTYSCTVTDPNRLPLAQSAIAGLGPRNSFWVWWDSSHTCAQIYIDHSSGDVP